MYNVKIVHVYLFLYYITKQKDANTFSRQQFKEYKLDFKIKI